MQHLTCNAQNWMRWCDRKCGRRASSLLHSCGNASGTMRLAIPLDGSNNMRRYLVGGESTGDFGVCFPGNDCLTSFYLEASPDPIHIEGSTNPVAFYWFRPGL